MNESELSIEDAISEIRANASTIENFQVRWSLKTCNVKRFTTKTIDLIRYLISIDEFNLPITTQLASAVSERSIPTLNTSLHTLGDKDVIMMLPFLVGGMTAWVISPRFKETFVWRTPLPTHPNRSEDNLPDESTV